ncbi:hypothetical protein M9H77_12893 [Catharanthus roseus]|uniref:Uncharacterized protein n=1 Tax=Catharanthus roseus TaxID=4058 RepID=A0ACC0BIL9_CATRO|nr:hypothetical protein M9H77_12893 [Catharanthus roseus]
MTTLIGGHNMLAMMRRLHIRDGPALAVEIVWEITWVYIENPANRDTHSVGYQPAGVDRRMMMIWLQSDTGTTFISVTDGYFCEESADYHSEVGYLACTPSQHDIQRTFPEQPSRHRPREPVPDRGARGVKRDASRLPGSGARDGRPPVPPFPGRHGHAVERGEGSKGGRPPVPHFPGRHGHANPRHAVERGEFGFDATFLVIYRWMRDILHVPPPPGLGFAPFHSPYYTSLGFSSFCAPPPPGIAVSFTPYQPISHASSSDEEEQTDDMTHVQHLGFGHCVGKKTTSMNNDEEMRYLWAILPHHVNEGIHILVEFE